MGEVVARFTVEGNPQPKQRPRFTKRGRAYTPPETVLAETGVMDAFFHVYPFWEPIDTFCGMHATFFREDRRRVDNDNLVKLVQDALNKHAFTDDYLLHETSQSRIYTQKGRGRTEVVLFLLDGDQTEVTA